MDPSSSPALSVESLKQAFPCHFSFDERRHLTHVGPGLAAVAPDAAPGVVLDRCFHFPESRTNARDLPTGPVTCVCRATGTWLSGSAVALPGTGTILVLPAVQTAEPMHAERALRTVLSESPLGVQLAIADPGLRTRAGTGRPTDTPTQELRRKGELFRLLAEHSGDIISRHAPDGTVQYVSAACRHVLGYEPEEVLGAAPGKYFHAEDRPAILAALPIARMGEPRDTITVLGRVRTRQGAWRWLEGNCAVIRDIETGAVVEIIAVSRDVTERVEVERELLLQRSVLERHVEERTEQLQQAYEQILQMNRELEARVQQRTNDLNSNVDFLQTLMDTIPDPIFYKNAYGVYQGCNAAFEQIAGFKRALLKSRTIDDLSPYADAALAKSTRGNDAEVLRDDGVKTYEETLRFADGSTRDVVLHKRRFLNADGRPVGLVGVILDVTEQKAAARSVARERAFLRSLIDTIPDPISFKDCDNVYLDCNRAFAALVGRPESEVVGRTDLDLFPPDVGAFFRALDGRTLNEGTPRRTEEWIDYPDGGRVLLDTLKTPFAGPDGEILGLIGISRDITQMKRAEDRMRILSSAVEQSPACVVVTDLSGTIEYVNPKFTEMTGYPADEAIGQTPRLLNSGTLPREFFQELWETIGAGREWHGVFANRKKDGEIYFEQASITGIRNTAGHITHYIALKEDITEQRQYESRLRAAKAAAESANLAKSAFLANMSHEIRTPMNAILGFTQLMEREGGLSDRVRGYLDVINRSGQHLLALINDVLEMSKIEAGRTRLSDTTFDLHHLLEDMAMMFATRARDRGLEFQSSRTRDVPRYVLADQGKLRQVLINLLGNAVKFTRQGRVGLRAWAQPGELGECRLCIEVEDTGRGISDEDLGRLFQYFEQAHPGDRSEGGTGLGLALSRQFARLMGGDVTATSILGGGSRFTLELPMHVAGRPQAEPRATASGRAIGLQPGQRPRNLLVVDDNEDNREFLTHLLTSLGFKIREARNGIQVIESLQKWLPDAILLDMRMPDMDGYEATRRLKNSDRWRGIPVIALSSCAFEEEREAMRAAGVDFQLAKPFVFADLLDVIEKATGVALQREQPAAPSPQKPPSTSPDGQPPLAAELVGALRDALARADLDRVMQLVAGVDGTQPELAATMRDLAGRYDYEGLRRVLDEPNPGAPGA